MITPALLGVIASTRASVDPQFADVVLYAKLNEGAGVTPVDYSANAIVPTIAGIGSIDTDVDADSFTGRALTWTASSGYLLFTKSGGFLPSGVTDFCVEVWGDIDSITNNAFYAAGRSRWLNCLDSVNGTRAGVSAQGTTDQTFIFTSTAATGFGANSTVGDLAGQGFTKFTRNHYVIQRVGSVTSYFFNGHYIEDEINGTGNFDEVRIGNDGVTSYYTAGSAECLRITAAQRYPKLTLVGGTFPNSGDQCFLVPTEPFPTS